MLEYYCFRFRAAQKIGLIHPAGKVGGADCIEYLSWKDKLPYFKKFFKFAGVSTRVRELAQYGRCVLGVMDNCSLLLAIARHARKAGFRDKLKLIHFFHGHSYGFDRARAEEVYGPADLWVYLTQKGYEHDFNLYHTMPCMVAVLENGIDKTVFHPLPDAQRRTLRREIWPSDSLSFLWVSADRKKKGLDVLLAAWPRIKLKHPEAHLKVIGASRPSLAGVEFLGHQPNQGLNRFYQSTDFYYFTSLCQEGFPLSLSEALCSGAFCISSVLGGAEQVLSKEGVAVHHPHMVSSWTEATDAAVALYRKNGNKNPFALQSLARFKDLDAWCRELEGVFAMFDPPPGTDSWMSRAAAPEPVQGKPASVAN